MTPTSVSNSITAQDDPDGIMQLAFANREAILLLEAVALLHDSYKLSDKFFAGQAGQGISGVLFTDPQLNTITNTDIKIVSFSVNAILKPIDGFRDLKKLLGLSRRESSLPQAVQTALQNLLLTKGFSSYALSDDPLALLIPYSLHGTGHYDKEESDAINGAGISFYYSSAFGVELNRVYPNPPTSFTNIFQNNLPIIDIAEITTSKRSGWIEIVKKALEQGIADTRRSTNELTLWDWATVVAALTKATLPTILKHGVPHTVIITEANGETRTELDLSAINYRVLCIGVDVVGLLEQVDKLADVLGLEKVLEDGFKNARKLLEETYPLANQIYHDTTGSYFLFPDFDLPPRLERELRGAFEPDIPLWINLNPVKVNAEKLNPKNPITRMSNSDALDEVKKLLAEPRTTVSQNFGATLPDLQKALWNNAWLQADKDGKHVDRCPVTKYYPVGYDQYAKFNTTACSRKISGVALNRRSGRVKDWLGELSTTVWMDEIADSNGKGVLIAASINLNNWLDGTLEGSLLASAIHKTSKFPSPARLNRIWETTQKFWQEQEEKLGLSVGWVKQRLELDVKNTGASFHSNYAYDAKLGKVQFSLVYDAQRQKLVMVDNLAYVAKQLGRDEDTATDSTQFMANRLRTASSGLTLFEEGAPARSITGFTVEAAQHDYLPAITILSEPNMFMVIVPGDKAMQVAEQIKKDYEEQFSKVQNRLPLHLNLVFFDRRTPLYSAIDTARRMLDRAVPTEVWRVEKKELSKTNQSDPTDNTACLELCRPSPSTEAIATDKMKVNVSYRLGDGTADYYYPYFFGEKAAPALSKNFTARLHHFKATFPGHDEKPMVHVSELEPGDEVYYMPSTFDFEYLDVTARRFEMNYHSAGQRITRSTRPFLLQDVEHFKSLWGDLSKGLTNTRLKQVGELLAEKRFFWTKFPTFGNDTLLREFARQTFARAFDDPGFKNNPKNGYVLVEWAANGRLDDLLELYTEIMKQDTDRTKEAKKQAQARSVANETATT